MLYVLGGISHLELKYVAGLDVLEVDVRVAVQLPVQGDTLDVDVLRTVVPGLDDEFTSRDLYGRLVEQR